MRDPRTDGRTDDNHAKDAYGISLVLNCNYNRVFLCFLCVFCFVGLFLDIAFLCCIIFLSLFLFFLCALYCVIATFR